MPTWCNDFLAMEEYPQIIFVATEVRQAGPTSLELTGDLTRGVTNSVRSRSSSRARPLTRTATCGSGSKAPWSSTARTTASPGTPRSRPAASWSATKSPSSSRFRDQDRLTFTNRTLTSGPIGYLTVGPATPLNPWKAPSHDHGSGDHDDGPMGRCFDRGLRRNTVVPRSQVICSHLICPERSSALSPKPAASVTEDHHLFSDHRLYRSWELPDEVTGQLQPAAVLEDEVQDDS